MARFGAPRSAPGYFSAILSTLVIATQVQAFIDTKPVMNQFNIRDENSVRVIALLLVAINGYDLIGALEDNWGVYWFSLISRIAATTLMYWLQDGWETLAPLELGGALVLAGTMWWSSR